MHDNIKFRVENETNSIAIQMALFRLGARWAATSPNDEPFAEKTDASFLFADKDERTGEYIIRYAGGEGRGDEGNFVKSPNVEYIYRLGMVEPRDGRPVQQVPPPVTEKAPVHVVVGGDMSDVNRVDSSALETVVVPLSTAKRVVPKSRPGVLPRPPLGLRPRYIAEGTFVKERIQEVREAMLRYIEAQKEIPYKWVNEFLELTAKVEKLEEID